MKLQSQNYPQNHLISNDEQSPYDTNTKSSQNIFHRDTLLQSDLIGNFSEGFIIFHKDKNIYLVDQHAASQKSIFEQITLNPTKKYPTIQSSMYINIPNFYKQTLNSSSLIIQQLGWVYQITNQKSIQLEVYISQCPSLYGYQPSQLQFINIVDSLYLEKVPNLTEYQKSSMASVACHHAYRLGEELDKNQMRSLIDSLYNMKGPFNCPHGRPTIIKIGKVQDFIKPIKINKQYKL